MKQFVKSMIVAGSLIAAPIASADWGDVIPFVGLDYYHAWMKGNSSWGTLFHKSYPGATLYVGAKFHENFGLEIGGDWSVKKSNSNVAIPSPFFGNAVPAGLTANARLKRSGGHIDLIGYLPVADCLELTGHIGVGWLHPKVQITTNFPANSSFMASALVSTAGKTKALVRLGIGLSYMVTEMVGLRAKLGWEDTSRLRVVGNTSFTALGFNTKGFKGSTTAAVGAFVRF